MSNQSEPFSDCILASSLSCDGKRVLQVDENQYYGASESSLSPRELCDSQALETLRFHSISGPEVKEELSKNSNISIDVSVPFVFLGRSKGVEELVRHQVSKYMNFLSVKDIRICIGSSGEWWTIPTDRSRIFSDKCLKLTEKRGLMTLFKSAAQSQSSTVHSTALVGGESTTTPNSANQSTHNLSSSAIAYLESHIILRPEIILGIIHGVCMYPLAAETMTAKQMLDKMSQFVASLDAYEPGCPFLIPTYGNGDIPQSFARMAAVHGASQILGCSLETINSELTGGTHVFVEHTESQVRESNQILHAVVVSRLREDDPKNVSFEVFVDTFSECPIFCITVPHSPSGDVRPGICPPGTCLRHYVRIISDEPSDIEAMVRLTGRVLTDEILFSHMFRETSFERDPNDFFGIESHVDIATRIFNKLTDRDAVEPLPVPPPPADPLEDTVE